MSFRRLAAWWSKCFQPLPITKEILRPAGRGKLLVIRKRKVLTWRDRARNWAMHRMVQTMVHAHLAKRLWRGL